MGGENLREEIFFMMYHMRQSKTNILELDPEERKWFIHRFVEQRKKENEEMEKARNRNKKK